MNKSFIQQRKHYTSPAAIGAALVEKGDVTTIPLDLTPATLTPGLGHQLADMLTAQEIVQHRERVKETPEEYKMRHVNKAAREFLRVGAVAGMSVPKLKVHHHKKRRTWKKA